MNIIKTILSVAKYTVDSNFSLLRYGKHVISGDLEGAILVAAKFSRKHPKITRFTSKAYHNIGEMYIIVGEAYIQSAKIQQEIMNCETRDDVKRLFSIDM